MTTFLAARRRTRPPGTRERLPAAYLAWLGAATVSQLGDVVIGFAIGWVAAGYGGAAAGLALAAGSVPTVVLLLLGGTVADRFGARRVMILGDATMIAVSACLAAAVLAVGSPLWLLLAVSVVRGTVAAFYRPAAGSMPRRLVPDRQLPSALALNQGASRAAGLVGAPFAGLLVGAGGLAPVAALDAATFALVLVVLVRVRPGAGPDEPAPPGAGQRPDSLRRAAWDGVLVVRRTPGLPAALLLLAGAAAFVLPTVSLLLPLLAREAGWTAQVTGLVAGAQATGTVVTTLVIARTGGRRRAGAATSAGLVVAAAGQAGLVFSAVGGTPVLAVGGAALVGVGAGIFSAHLAPLVLGGAPRTHLARVQALVSLVQILAATLTNAALGVLASATSAGFAASVCLVGVLGCAAVGARALGSLTGPGTTRPV